MPSRCRRPCVSEPARRFRSKSSSHEPFVSSRLDPIARHWSRRLPFYYGWLIVGIAFVTMAIAVTARTSFSLLLPPLTDEFGWDRGLIAGAFSFGFLLSALLAPITGRLMDRYGPQLVIGIG